MRLEILQLMKKYIIVIIIAILSTRFFIQNRMWLEKERISRFVF